MSHDLTHASFFSGVGGLDLGLERAGWRTVSFSEIDPYASNVLAERWPGVPNLGDILEFGTGDAGVPTSRRGRFRSTPDRIGRTEREQRAVDWTNATLWSGGFPCQDLSVAGKRRGLAGERSGLAFAFLDLVERHRPPAILLENVPGLLSSHGGKDLGALLSRLGELGYWWAYRILDAQFFGVPQRRRRVFICALHAGAGFGADSAAAVLSVGARCGGHSAAGDEARTSASDGLAAGISRALSTSQERLDADTESFIVGTLREHVRPGSNTDHTVLSPSPDPGGVREADGLAGRLDDRPMGLSENQRGELLLTEIAHQLTSGGGKPGQGYPAILAPTLRVGPQRPQDGGPGDTVPIIAATLNSGGNDGGFRTEPGEHLIAGVDANRSGVGDMEEALLPLGLDSHRYRCCGNGVVSNVAEWIGWRLREIAA